MTDTTSTPGNELERRVEAPVSRADTDSWTQVVGVTARLAQEIAGTEFVPRDLRGKPAAVTAAILYGREIGLPPMTALTQTHVIEGKPAASAEAMRALVLAAGHELVVVETTGAVCTMRARRRGSSTWTDLSWTLDMARAAGLLSAKKENWQKYPRAMLQARCSAELIRLVFPDVVLGMVALEELDLEPPAETGESVVSRAPAAAAPPRKRAARKAAPPTDAQPAPPAAGGMPLPGEDGYVEPTRKAPDAATGADLPADPVPDDQTPAETAPGPTEAEIDAAGPDEQQLDEDGAVDAEVVEEAHEEQRPTPAPVTRAQVRMIGARIAGLAKDVGVEVEDNDRRAIVRVLAGREEPIASTNDLTKHEGSAVIDTLTRVSSLEELYAIVEATVAAMRDPS